METAPNPISKRRAYLYAVLVIVGALLFASQIEYVRQHFLGF